MSHSQRALLVGDILREQFGPIMQAIGVALLERGRATIDELVRAVGQKQTVDVEWSAFAPQSGSKRKPERSLKRAVTDAVLTGIQHNFIGILYESRRPGDGKVLAYAAVIEGRDELREAAYYYLDTSRVLVRLRFAKFLLASKRRFGDVGEAIIDELLAEGRLTSNAILSAIQNRVHESEADQQRVLSDMCRNGFLIEASNNYLSPVSELQEKQKHPELKPDLSDHKRLKITSMAPSSSSKRSSAKPKTPASGETPELTLYAEQNKDNQLSTSKTKKRPLSEPAAAEPARKRFKKASAVADSELAAPFDLDPSIVWCVSYSRLGRVFRDATAAAFIREKFDLNAASLFEATVGALEPTGYLALRGSSADEPYALAIARMDEQYESVIAEARLVDVGRNINIQPERVRHYADIFARHPAKLFVLNQQPAGYRVNMPAVMQMCRRRLIESIVGQKFGGDCLRIFRLLGEKPMLELKQVSEYAMLPAAEAKQALFKLLQAHLVHMQPVPKGSGGGGDLNRTYFLWSILWYEAEEVLVDNLYGAIRRSRSRLSHTFGMFHHLHRKAEEEERLNSKLLTETETQMLLHAKSMEDRLQTTILRLDDHVLTLENPENL